MSATTTIRPEVDAYLERVRAALADLPADERDDLLADVEASVVDAAAEGGAISARLGPPEDFAAELRAAAGFQDTAAPPPPGVGDRIRAALRSPRAVAARETLEQLAPIWWAARAYLAVALLGLWWGSEWSTLLPPLPLIGTAVTTLAVLAVVVVASIWLGLRTRRAGDNFRRGALVLNALFVLGAFPVAGHLLDTRRIVVTSPEPAPPTDGLVYYGIPVDNIYPYTRDGRLLHDVLLYDGAGRPLDVRVGDTDTSRRVLRTPSGEAIFNSFPIRYFEPGTARVADPDAAPPVPKPKIVTPPLTERR